MSDLRPFLAPGESRTERDGDGIRLEWRDQVSKALKWVTWSLDELAELERTGRILRPAPTETLTVEEEQRRARRGNSGHPRRSEGNEIRRDELRRKYPGLDKEDEDE